MLPTWGYACSDPSQSTAPDSCRRGTGWCSARSSSNAMRSSGRNGWRMRCGVTRRPRPGARSSRAPSFVCDEYSVRARSRRCRPATGSTSGSTTSTRGRSSASSTGRVRFARYGEDDRAAYTLDHALALWRGEPLADLEGWPPAAAEAVRLQELRRLGEERRAETLLARAEHERLIPIARSLLADDRFRERRWELLALGADRGGRQAEALRVLADARRLLRDELGIEPRKELLELEQQILDQDPSIAAPVVAPRAPERTLPVQGPRVLRHR